MKTYAIHLAVPDDFDPQKLDLDISYPDDIQVIGEGSPWELSGADVTKLTDAVKEKMSFLEMPKDPNSVIVFQFPKESVQSYEDSQGMSIVHHMIEDVTGCQVLGLVNDIDLMIQRPQEAMAMLEGMMAKIRILNGTNSTAEKKIILN